MVRWLALAVVLAACQGGDSAPAAKKTEAPAVKHLDAIPPPPPPTGSAEGSEAPEDPGKAITDLGAVPAWQAVVDRAQYLARRGQHGVVYGALGPAIMVPAPVATGSGSGSAVRPVDAGLVASPYTWLVDDTEGNGALAIRVDLGKKAGAFKEGDRLALGGAWALDDSRRWYWKVDNAQVLPAVPPVKAGETRDSPVQPGHVIPTGDFPPGVKRISLAKDGDLAYFQVVGAPPAVDGDGWPVADELGNPVVALLVLPGERASYGAQDMRTPDERWQLRRGQTYWVRIGRTHKRGPDKPLVMYARTPPVWVR